MKKIISALLATLLYAPAGELVNLITILIDMIPEDLADPESKMIQTLQAFSNQNNNKIMTIKMLRTLQAAQGLYVMGLKEAKDYVEQHCKFYHDMDYTNGMAFKKCPHCGYKEFIGRRSYKEFKDMRISDSNYVCSNCDRLIGWSSDSLIFEIERG